MAVEVAAGLLLRGDTILACQRRDDQPHPGKWEFPGGKREAGESIADCLRRELHEELGIEADVGAEVFRTEHTYPGRAPVELVFFVVRSYRGTIENKAFASVRWVRPNQLTELDFLEADREFIDRLARGDIDLAS